MAAIDELSSQRFYHGTKADLKPGDVSGAPENHIAGRELVLRRVELRGIGTNELVWVSKTELQRLDPADTKLFRKVSAVGVEQRHTKRAVRKKGKPKK
jgi:hypothetical protein